MCWSSQNRDLFLMHATFVKINVFNVPVFTLQFHTQDWACPHISILDTIRSHAHFLTLKIIYLNTITINQVQIHIIYNTSMECLNEPNTGCECNPNKGIHEVSKQRPFNLADFINESVSQEDVLRLSYWNIIGWCIKLSENGNIIYELSREIER